MFKECNKACVYSQDGVYLAEVRVLDAETEDIGLVFEEEDIDMVSTESIVVFYDDIQGLVTCECRLAGRVRITGKELGDKNGAIFKIPCHIDEIRGREQRRQDLKVTVRCTVELLMAEDEKKTKRVKAKMKNISAGGAGFETAGYLRENQIFSFPFTIAGEVLWLTAIVVWKKNLAAERKEPYYYYGCSFFGLTASKESAVRRFVYQEQMKRRKVEDSLRG